MSKTAKIGYFQFLQQLPQLVLPQLPRNIRLSARQPYRWLLQFYDQDKSVHYEVQRIARRQEFELGLHFESRKPLLNQHMLTGFSRRLIEIQDCLGPTIEAEQWDRGWTKIYEIYPAAQLTHAYQQQLADRLAAIICCLHPILLDLYDTPLERRRHALKEAL